MREIHAGPPGHAHDRSHGRRHHLRRPQHRLHPCAQVCRNPIPAEDPDGVPGPHRQPESALHRLRHDSGAAAPACGRKGSGNAHRAGVQRSKADGTPGGIADALSAPAVRRPEGEGRDRTRHRPAAGTADPRRAHRGAGCVGAGDHPQAPGRAARNAGHELPVRFPRPQRGPHAVRSRDRDVSRQGRGAGAHRGGIPPPGASLYGRADPRDPVHRRTARGTRSPCRRGALPG